MRFKKDSVKEREEFVTQAVTSNPSLTGEQLQELLQTRFGHKMRRMRLYELKNAAIAASNGTPPAPAADEPPTQEF